MEEIWHVEPETKDTCSLVWNRGECTESLGRMAADALKMYFIVPYCNSWALPWVHESHPSL